MDISRNVIDKSGKGLDMIVDELYAMQDKDYADFQSALIPTLSREKLIGVRVPDIRKLARKHLKDNDYVRFLQELPHSFHEENMLHAFLIAEITDYETCIREVNNFLPYIDNWAVCDGLSPKIFKTDRKRLIKNIDVWLKSEHSYTVRFAIGMLMKHFLDENFDKRYPAKVAAVRSQDYYVKMMIAWYYATALSKQWEECIQYIMPGVLEEWTRKKAISKAIESYRITAEEKNYLKQLR